MQPKETKPFLGPSKGERLRRAQRMMSFSVLLRFMDGARWWMAMMRRVWRSGRGRSNCFPVIVLRFAPTEPQPVVRQNSFWYISFEFGSFCQGFSADEIGVAQNFDAWIRHGKVEPKSLHVHTSDFS